MPLPFSATIDAEVQRAHLSVIDLIQVDFGNSIERRWSTAIVPASFSIGLTGNYEARLVSLGERSWSLGSDDDSVSLVLGNSDDTISNFARSYGIDIFEGAKVRHHRLFPGIKETYFDYWVGKGSAMRFEELTARWDVKFGFSSLRQRALRRYQRNCAHVFAGGLDSDCPYDPVAGFGIPKPEIFGIATVGTNNNRVRNASVNAFQNVVAGMQIYNRNANCVSKVTNVVTHNEISVSNPVAGFGAANSFARWQTGDKYFIGFPYTSCDKTPIACAANGMYGPDDQNPEGIMDSRRYFGGSNDVANISFKGREPGEGTRFTRSTLGNNSFDGRPIPVIFGVVRIYDIESIAHANAGRFQHGLFIIGEGEILDIDFPMVDNIPVDDFSQEDLRTAMQETGINSHAGAVAYRDAFLKYGTWKPNGLDDNRANAAPSNIAQDIAMHVRGLYGRRSSFGVTYSTIVDSYGWRDADEKFQIGNPQLFVDGSGGGVSLHGLAAARIRIDTDRSNSNVLRGAFTIYGLLTPLVPGSSNNTEDRSLYNLPKNIQFVDPIKYTAHPNPIQSAYSFLTNRRWGAGMSSSNLHLDSFRSESNYCEEIVDRSTVAAKTGLFGVVNITPQGLSKYPRVEEYIFTYSLNSQTETVQSALDLSKYAQSLIGRKIVFNPKSPGNSYSAIILAAHYYVKPTVKTVTNILDDGLFIRLDRVAPPVGTLFSIAGLSLQGNSKRYKANGILTDDITAVEMFESILNNCHAVHRTSAGKLEVIIKKELSEDQIDTIVSEHLFTDRGSKRNIIHNNGVSSIRVWRENTEDVVNEYSVDFLDPAREYRISRLVVFDDRAQIRAATKLGEHGDRKRVTEVSQLFLTADIDQAKRLLALRTREKNSPKSVLFIFY